MSAVVSSFRGGTYGALSVSRLSRYARMVVSNVCATESAANIFMLSVRDRRRVRLRGKCIVEAYACRRKPCPCSLCEPRQSAGSEEIWPSSFVPRQMRYTRSLDKSSRHMQGQTEGSQGPGKGTVAWDPRYSAGRIG
jgi:hypothetical protein